jgi:hypothetical protein
MLGLVVGHAVDALAARVADPGCDGDIGRRAMVFELAWTRALSLVIGSSAYAFTAVLVVVLIGIAAGSAVYVWRWGERQAGPSALAAIEIGVGAFTALALLGFERLPDLLLTGIGWSGAPGWVAFL